MHNLKITLKQHTPLIHFQHDQEGATLRASEVKPKLDRFVLTRLGKNSTQQQLEAGKTQHRKDKIRLPFEELDDLEKGRLIAKELGWLVGNGEHAALNYKMKFVIRETPVVSDNNEVQKDRQGNAQLVIRKDGRTIKKLKPYPLFFANLNVDIDDPSEYKRFSMLSRPFDMEIFCLYDDLLLLLKDRNLWPVFFQYTNFGTRQSKGFGSFYIDEKDKDYYADIEELRYRFSIDIRSESKKWNDLFETIDLFYKSLRSGINICWGEKFYMKPAIFQYAKDKGFEWDKKLIKQFFLDGKKPDGNNNCLFKDMLGLSSEESWMSYGTVITKKDKDDEIQRFKSPIVIKPIRRKDYFDVFIDLCPDSVQNVKDFRDKKFKIESKKSGDSLTLTSFPDFDIDEFLEFALLKNTIGNLTKDQDHEKYQKLKSIYNEIKREHE